MSHSFTVGEDEEMEPVWPNYFTETLRLDDCSQVNVMTNEGICSVFIPDHVDYISRPSKCVRFSLNVGVRTVPPNCSSRVGTWVQDAAREEREAREAARLLELDLMELDNCASISQEKISKTAKNQKARQARSIPFGDILSLWDEPPKPITTKKRISRLEARYMGDRTAKSKKNRTKLSESPPLSEFGHPFIPCVKAIPPTLPTSTSDSCLYRHSTQGSAVMRRCSPQIPCAECDPNTTWMDYIFAVSETECHRKMSRPPICSSVCL